MAGEHKKPKFWINPKSRLTFPQFRVVWHQCGKQELIDFCSVEQPRRLTYRTVSACLHILYEADYSVLHILYSEEIAFENMTCGSLFLVGHIPYIIGLFFLFLFILLAMEV